MIKNSPLPAIAPLIERIMAGFQKLLAQPSCLAKSAIYIALSSLIEACNLHVIPIVPTMIPLLKEGLRSSDWNDRKEAVETIHTLVVHLREAMAPFSEEILQFFEDLKFDKVLYFIHYR